VPQHRPDVDGAGEMRIVAVQGPLDFIEPALLVFGKFHGSSLSREPTAALPSTISPAGERESG
jgi:hypothetical protein